MTRSSKQEYEDRFAHLETPEFKKWFETWYTNEEAYGDNPLLDAYFTERSFALVGWLAGRTGVAHLLSKQKFVLQVIPPRGEVVK